METEIKEISRFFDLEDFETDIAETSKDADAVLIAYVVPISSENKMNSCDTDLKAENHEIDFTITINQLKFKLVYDSLPIFNLRLINLI